MQPHTSVSTRAAFANEIMREFPFFIRIVLRTECCPFWKFGPGSPAQRHVLSIGFEPASRVHAKDANMQSQE